MAVGENGKIYVVESEINKHMMNIMDSSSKIKAILSKIDDQMANLKSYYSCAAANKLYSQYEQFNDNYAIIVDNILSYNKDLMSLKKSCQATVSELTQKLQIGTARLTDGVKFSKEER